VDAVTVNAVAEVDTLGVTLVIAGEPARPPLTSVKSEASTPFTASEKVTDHCTDAAFVGDGPARLIETTDGFVRSITQVYEVIDDFEPETAFTWNVCEPAVCEPGYVLLPEVPDPQATNATPSSEHWKLTDTESVYVNAATCEFVGFDGFTVITGAGGPESASATAAVPITASTPSRTAITAVLRAALIGLIGLISD